MDEICTNLSIGKSDIFRGSSKLFNQIFTDMNDLKKLNTYFQKNVNEIIKFYISYDDKNHNDIDIKKYNEFIANRILIEEYILI